MTMHVLSFGGGVNSTALMIHIIRSGSPLDGVVFADTGAEVPETYEYLRVVEDYLAKHGVPLNVVANRIAGRDLYQTCWNRQVIPSAIWRWSTRDFKVRPIHKYYRSLGKHVDQYLAIAYDEFHRMKTSKVDYVSNLYPLVEEKITRADCVKIIEQAGLPQPVKSSCFFCPFGSMDRWQWLYDTHPELYEKAIALEEHSKHFPAQRLTDQIFRTRAQIPLRSLPPFFGTKNDQIVEKPDEPCGGECMT